MHKPNQPPHTFRIPVVGAILDAWSALRRLFDPTEWTARLLRLPTFERPNEPGLVLIQIDGLSQHELQLALDRGEMPQLKRLLTRERYRIHSMYSGLPSTTAGVQGELFYGRRVAVPAFAFGDRTNGKVIEMLSPERVEQVERELASNNAGLPQGGSSYCNVYTGGALESHFSVATLGWNGMFSNMHPCSLLLAPVLHFLGVLRIVAKLVWESLLISFDLLRGLVGNLPLKREWQRVASRLVVGVVLEELMTMAAKVDLVRGLPIVQFNFLSYDECGHLRGPDSPMAHRALSRIDAELARVWRAADRAHSRHYAVWIYSDHGQERTTPYDELASRTFAEAVGPAFGLNRSQVSVDRADPVRTRTHYLRRRRASSVETEQPAAPTSKLLVAAIGPVAHLYLPQEITDAEVRRGCRSLATEHQVPMVLRRRDDGKLDVWTSDGEWQWPRDAAHLMGADHPFAAALIDDLPALCAHRHAGDVVALGRRAGVAPISFVLELGAHGGAGPRETGAFAILPVDAPVFAEEQTFLRPNDLRLGALRMLGRGESTVRKRAPRLPTKTLRFVTYNVHSCAGLDGRISPERIARVLAQCDADVIALQELDVMKQRTGRLDQTAEIARRLESEYQLFHPAISVADERYGDAILSRLPLRLVRAGSLPGAHLKPRLERRGAIWASVDWDGREVQVVNTHLGLHGPERSLQVDTLLGPEWLGHPECRDPVVFCGDWNMTPGSKPLRRIATQLRDCQCFDPGRRPRNTWFAPFPLARIDHLFVRGPIEIAGSEVLRTRLTAVASDHLPLIADIRWSESDEPS